MKSRQNCLGALLALAAVPGVGQTLFADGDYLTPEMRAGVEALKADVRTVPTTLNNLEARCDVLWAWTNALALKGVMLPVELPRIITQSRQTLVLRQGPLPVILPFINEVVRELEIKEEEPAAIGTVTSTAKGPYTADSYVTFEQTYTVGDMPMAEGGGVMVAWELVARLDPYNREDPKAKNFISIRSSNPDARFENATKQILGMHGNIFGAIGLPVYKLRGTTLNKGETLTVTYGDTSGGSPGVQLQTTEVDGVMFPLYVDLEGKGNFLSPQWPSFRVVGGKALRARAVAPSVVKPGEKFSLAVRVEDAYYNRATVDVPVYEVVLNDEAIGKTKAGEGLSVIEDMSLSTPGVYRYELHGADNMIAATSNPILVEENPVARIYWGDTHAHTNMAEAQGNIPNFYRFAREDARLDFVVLSEHDTWLDDREWENMRAAAREQNQPGRFLAYLGYEWTATVDFGGHHNVLFRTPENRKRAAIQDNLGVSKLFERLRSENDSNDVLVIPHAHIPGDWRVSDPSVERLVEMISMHGTFEWFGNYYLQRGHEIGFTGASDDHSGRPGYSGPFQSGPLQQLNGIGAVFASELTNDAIFDAMRNRATYATSGQRAILNVTLNGAQIGTRTAFSTQREIKGKIYATAPIETIELIKNGTVAHGEDYLAREPSTNGWVRVAFASPSEDYIRDTPRGHRVWKGTLEVAGATLKSMRTMGLDNAYLETVAVDPANSQRVAFNLITRGRDDMILLQIEGASADTSISFHLDATDELGVTFPRFYKPGSFPAAEFRLDFSDIKAGFVSHDLPAGRYTDHVSAQFIEPDGPLDREINITDTKDCYDGDYYYVRIKQLDGNMVWSSPWWVGGVPVR